MSRRTRPAGRTRTTTTALFTTAALFALAACGGSTDADTSSKAAGDNTAGVKAAEQVLAQYAKRPTSIGITQPVGKAIPTGKKIDFILCGVQSCQDLANYFTEAAKVLGWSVNKIPTQGTPQSVQAAWTQAVRDKPDAVVASGFPRSVFAKQLKQLKDMDIPVVESSTDDKAGDGISILIDGPDVVDVEGRIMASWVTSDSKGAADTVYFDLPTYGILKPVADTFRSDYEKWCSGCGYDKVDVPISAIGKDMPDRVVSYVRSHPKVTHIAFSLALLNVGVPAALRAAGLQNKVHTIVNVGESTNYEYIDSGQTQAAIGFNNIENAWAQADGLARHFTGQSMKVTQDAQLPFMLIDKDNLISTKTQFPLVADYQAQFKTLWGKN
ncbi:substrate-binding domain-containing protein [Streptomyces sp. NPDC087903]|uniref:substrate-binding domain-containing protein n=1 Tax=Streptomyces sp. NPDC087903 TaxID=3365819 RepID=UPI00381B9D29